MWFWIRNLTLLVVLGGLAYLVLTKPEYIFRKDTANKAAKGFSEFYASISGSIADGARQLSEFKIELPDTSDKLTLQLVQRGKVTIPMNETWRGSVIDRRFREGETVKTKLTEFARADGMELYWTLPRDYVIKQYFQIDTTLVDTVNEVAVAIAPDFSSPVLAYFCPRERALVITDKVNAHLQQYCITADTPPAKPK